MPNRVSRCTALAAAIMLAASPAAAADDFRTTLAAEQHRSAFAGATLRLELGGRRTGAAALPQARLAIGTMPYRRDASGALLSQGGTGLPLAAGLSAGRLHLFLGGERLSRIERRLQAAGSTTTLIVIGAVAAGAVAVALLVDGDGDGPCPPGVEVCAFD